MTCASCGSAAPEAAKFCPECGATLAAACTTCGTGLVPGAKFCAECGTPVTAQAPAGATRSGSGSFPGVAPQAVAERRVVTILFADLVGFTTLAEGRDAEAVKKMYQALLEWDQRPRYAELKALQIPSLVIVGANEPQKTIELAYEWHQQFAQSEFVVLRDTYHAAPRENALVWNQTVRGFLERHGLGR